MHALTKGAIGVAALASMGAPVRNYERAPVVAKVVSSAAPVVAPLAAIEPWRCGPRMVPVKGPQGKIACLSLPEVGARLQARPRRLAQLPPSPAFLKWTAPTESIPRLPERSAHYGDYQLPVAEVVSVNSPMAESPVGPGRGAQPGSNGQPRPKLGVNIVTAPGAAVTLVDLEGETGRPEVVLVGELYGITVVVRHRVVSDDADGAREYLVFYGNLARPGPSVTSGTILSPLSVVGFVGDRQDEEPTLYFEVRSQQEALAGPALHLTELVSKSMAVDPRNVLPLIGGVRP